MNYPLFLASRLSPGSSDGHRRKAPGVKVAVAAVALSVAVMIVSIGVVTGFKNEITKKVLGFNSDIQLFAASKDDSGRNVVTLEPSLEAILDSCPGVKSYSLQVTIPGVLKTESDFKGIYLRTLDDEDTRRFLAANLDEGSLPKTGSKGMVISRLAADRLGLKCGDMVYTYFFSDDIRVRRLTVSGIFNSHFDSYDQVTGFTEGGVLRGITRLEDDEGSSLRVNLYDPSQAGNTADLLQSEIIRAAAEGRISQNLTLTTVQENGAVFFQWLSLLDTNVAVIIALMALVGCVTLIGGMLMIILDKKRFIGILKSLGASSGKIKHVFVLLTLRVACVGLLAGNAIGLGVLHAQWKWHIIPLDPDAYYIDFVPVSIHWGDMAILNAGVILLMYLALILPSRVIAGISPAETMRGQE